MDTLPSSQSYAGCAKKTILDRFRAGGSQAPLNWQRDLKEMQSYFFDWNLNWMEADGNCLFRAVASLLDGNDTRHAEYRAAAVEELKKSATCSIMQMYVPKGDVLSYANKMANNGIYGGLPEIMVLSRILNVAIWVTEIERGKIPAITYHYHSNEKPEREIHLVLNVDKEHYYSAKRISSDNGVGLNAPQIKYQGDWDVTKEYTLLEHIGTGSSATIWKAKSQFGMECAIKIIEFNHQMKENMRDRMQEEVVALEKAINPNIIRLMDYVLTDNFAYMIYEYCNGNSLKEEIRKGRPIPEETCLRILRQLITAMKVLRREGIIHNDIKPENILIHDDQIIKLADFGSCKILEAQKSSEGSPIYMSPEKIKGEEYDSLSDMWSLGVTLFEMLTGRLPFEGSDFDSLLNSITLSPLEFPSNLNIRERTKDLIKKMLRNNKTERLSWKQLFTYPIETEILACEREKKNTTPPKGPNQPANDVMNIDKYVFTQKGKLSKKAVANKWLSDLEKEMVEKAYRERRKANQSASEQNPQVSQANLDPLRSSNLDDKTGGLNEMDYKNILTRINTLENQNGVLNEQMNALIQRLDHTQEQIKVLSDRSYVLEETNKGMYGRAKDRFSEIEKKVETYESKTEEMVKRYENQMMNLAETFSKQNSEVEQKMCEKINYEINQLFDRIYPECLETKQEDVTQRDGSTTSQVMIQIESRKMYEKLQRDWTDKFNEITNRFAEQISDINNRMQNDQQTCAHNSESLNANLQEVLLKIDKFRCDIMEENRQTHITLTLHQNELKAWKENSLLNSYEQQKGKTQKTRNNHQGLFEQKNNEMEVEIFLGDPVTKNTNFPISKPQSEQDESKDLQRLDLNLKKLSLKEQTSPRTKPKLLSIPWNNRIIRMSKLDLKIFKGRLDEIAKVRGSDPIREEKEKNYKIRFFWNNYILFPTEEELIQTKGDLNLLFRVCKNFKPLRKTNPSFKGEEKSSLQTHHN